MNGFVATKIVVDAVFTVAGNDGPDFAAAAFRRIRVATRISDTDAVDYQDISGLRLLNFTAENCDQAQSLTDAIWQECVTGAEGVWHRSRPFAFPRENFIPPQVFDCQTSLTRLAGQLILCWGA